MLQCIVVIIVPEEKPVHRHEIMEEQVDGRSYIASLSDGKAGFSKPLVKLAIA